MRDRLFFLEEELMLIYFFPLFGDDQLKNSSLYFYDFNGKLNYKLGENDRIFLSGYNGRDNFSFNDEFGFDWGNTTGNFKVESYF